MSTPTMNLYYYIVILKTSTKTSCISYIYKKPTLIHYALAIPKVTEPYLPGGVVGEWIYIKRGGPVVIRRTSRLTIMKLDGLDRKKCILHTFLD